MTANKSYSDQKAADLDDDCDFLDAFYDDSEVNHMPAENGQFHINRSAGFATVEKQQSQCC